METYMIDIGHGHIILECDVYELTYSKDGRVYEVSGCIALAKDF